MKLVFLLGLCTLGLSACQKNESSSPTTPPKAPPSVIFLNDFSSCQKKSSPGTLQGVWMAHYKKMDSEVEVTSTLTFNPGELVTEVREVKGELVCDVASTSNIVVRSQTIPTEFQILTDVKSTNSISSADGKTTLTCDGGVSAGIYTYSFDGACLVIKSPLESFTYEPVEEKPTGPVAPPNLPPASVPTPSTKEVVPTPPSPELSPVSSKPEGADANVGIDFRYSWPRISPVVLSICDSFSSSLEQSACYQKLKDIFAVDDTIATTCFNYSTPLERQNCVDQLRDAEIWNISIARICNSDDLSLSQQRSCIIDFDRKKIDLNYIDHCLEEFGTLSQLKCLKKALKGP